MSAADPGGFEARDGIASKRLWRGAAPVALAIYVGLALLLFGSRGSWTMSYIGMGYDPISFIWFLNWWPFALRHGLDLFWTHYVWFPQGFDLAWATSVPVLAWLAAPVTAVLGPVFAFNLISVLAPALSAWTAYLLGRDLTRDDVAAFFSGWFFGFSAYEAGQLTAHLNLAAIFVVPLLVMLVLRRFRGVISRRLFVSLVAVLLFIQVGISMEIAATACTIGAVVWLVFRWFGEPADRPALWRLAFEVAIALCGVLVLALPYEISLLRGATAAPGIINSPWWYSADLLNYVLPTALQRFGHAVVAPITARFTGNISENGAYLGLPLIAILIAAARQFRRTPRLRALAIAIAVLAVLSLGPVLHVAGRTFFIPLPWAAFLNLPLIRAALPVRIAMYVSLAAGLLVAAWIAAGRDGGRGARIGAALVAGLFLLPAPLAFAWSRVPETPAALKPPALTARLGAMPNLLILPFGESGPGMAWQLGAKMGFIQSGGYVGFTPKQAMGWPAIRELRHANPSPHFADDLAAYCVSHRVTAIAMGPATPARLADAVLTLGWPVARLQGVTFVRVPPVATLDYFAITGDYWPSDREFGWIGHAVRIRAGRRPLVVTLSGAGRPAKLPAVAVTVTMDTGRRIYRLDRASRIRIDMPAGSTASVEAARTFRSTGQYNRGGKPYGSLSRNISVQIAIMPQRASAAPADGSASGD